VKKTVAILLLTVYLFNLCGYPVVFHYFIQQSESVFVQQLDANEYDDNDLVQISIPLHLPYMQNSGHYERVNGTFEDNGTQYNYVKRKVHNDTLYIMCLPNKEKTQLVNEKLRYANGANDVAGTKKAKESSAKKINVSTEYNQLIAQHNFEISSTVIPAFLGSAEPMLLTTFLAIPGQPPKQGC